MVLKKSDETLNKLLADVRYLTDSERDYNHALQWCAEVQHGLNQLQQRIAIEAREDAELPLEDIATKLEISRAQAYKQYNQFIKQEHERRKQNPEYITTSKKLRFSDGELQQTDDGVHATSAITGEDREHLVTIIESKHSATQRLQQIKDYLSQLSEAGVPISEINNLYAISEYCIGTDDDRRRITIGNTTYKYPSAWERELQRVTYLRGSGLFAMPKQGLMSTDTKAHYRLPEHHPYLRDGGDVYEMKVYLWWQDYKAAQTQAKELSYKSEFARIINEERTKVTRIINKYTKAEEQ